jgi:hypothetical protein
MTLELLPAVPLESVVADDFKTLAGLINGGFQNNQVALAYHREDDTLTSADGQEVPLDGALEPFLAASTGWLPDTGDLDVCFDSGLVLPGTCLRGGDYHFDFRYGPHRGVLISDELVTNIVTSKDAAHIVAQIRELRAQRRGYTIQELCKHAIDGGQLELKPAAKKLQAAGITEETLHCSGRNEAEVPIFKNFLRLRTNKF